jgi:hypothetical protein
MRQGARAGLNTHLAALLMHLEQVRLGQVVHALLLQVGVRQLAVQLDQAACVRLPDLLGREADDGSGRDGRVRSSQPTPPSARLAPWSRL